MLAGRFLLRTGDVRLLLVGSFVLALGTVGLAVFGHSAVGAGVAAGVMGLGMGLVSTPVLIVIQTSVARERRGAATALNQFARTVGGAVGVGLLGILVQGSTSPSGIRAGIDRIFWVMVAVAVASLVLGAGILLLSRQRGAVVVDRGPAG